LAVWHGSHDGRIADALLDHLGRRITVLADKACDTEPIRQLIQDRVCKLKHPAQEHRRWKLRFSKRLYRERHLIERKA
jgi:transposase